jgi:hypothetical protein
VPIYKLEWNLFVSIICDSIEILPLSNLEIHRKVLEIKIVAMAAPILNMPDPPQLSLE